MLIGKFHKVKSSVQYVYKSISHTNRNNKTSIFFQHIRKTTYFSISETYTKFSYAIAPCQKIQVLTNTNLTHLLKMLSQYCFVHLNI